MNDMESNRIYDRAKAVEYAHEWAKGRNPAYYNFDGIGGDCTNFVSQCLFAGCGIMNYTRDTGWYYRSPNDRAAAWSGVEYLYRFLVANKKAGPYGTEQPIHDFFHNVREGDIIQLSYDGQVFGHSLFVVGVRPEILVAHHSSVNCDNRPLTTYEYARVRWIHIDGVRT